MSLIILYPGIVLQVIFGLYFLLYSKTKCLKIQANQVMLASAYFYVSSAFSSQVSNGKDLT